MFQGCLLHAIVKAHVAILFLYLQTLFGMHGKFASFIKMSLLHFAFVWRQIILKLNCISIIFLILFIER